MARRRFGVSMPEELAEKLDRASRILGAPRSSLVEDAVRSLVEEIDHLGEPHECAGVVVARCERPGITAETVQRHRSIVVAHFHVHLRGECIDLIAVEGPSERIADLLSHLKNHGCHTRYLPLSHVRGGAPTA